jgi:Protein of unknown function (DUF2589)
MSANIGAELQALPLGYMLASPLTAAIEAQALAAKTTINFIENVAFTDDNGTLKVRTAEFTYTQTVADPNNPAETVEKDAKLTVPFITLVPVPYIRISDLNVQFEFKIRDVQTASSSKNLTKSSGLQVDVNAKAKFGGGLLGFLGAPSGEIETKTKFNMNVSATYQSSSRQTTDRSATFKMTMNAVQDAIPEGLARTLAILADTIKGTPKPDVP